MSVYVPSFYERRLLMMTSAAEPSLARRGKTPEPGRGGAEKAERMTFRRFAINMKRQYVLYIMLFFPMLYFLIFKYIPMYGVIIAFKNFNLFQGILASKWVGLDIFKEIFRMPEFYRALRNTLVLNLLDLIFGFPAPIILALVLNEIRIMWFKKVTQTILYLPHFLSWVIIGSIVYQVFSNDGGLVNDTLKAMGMGGIPFLSKSGWWIGLYVAAGIWQGTGWGTILYLAAMTGIDPQLYEAAEIDGATRFQRMWHITMPGILPTTMILLIMTLGGIVSIGFDRPFVLGNTLVINVSDVISTYVYRIGLQNAQFSIGTAVGLFQSVVGLVFLLLTNFISQKVTEQGLF